MKRSLSPLCLPDEDNQWISAALCKLTDCLTLSLKTPTGIIIENGPRCYAIDVTMARAPSAFNVTEEEVQWLLLYLSVDSGDHSFGISGTREIHLRNDETGVIFTIEWNEKEKSLYLSHRERFMIRAGLKLFFSTVCMPLPEPNDILRALKAQEKMAHVDIIGRCLSYTDLLAADRPIKLSKDSEDEESGTRADNLICFILNAHATN